MSENRTSKKGMNMPNFLYFGYIFGNKKCGNVVDNVYNLKGLEILLGFDHR